MPLLLIIYLEGPVRYHEQNIPSSMRIDDTDFIFIDDAYHHGAKATCPPLSTTKFGNKENPEAEEDAYGRRTRRSTRGVQIKPSFACNVLLQLSICLLVCMHTVV